MYIVDLTYCEDQAIHCSGPLQFEHCSDCGDSHYGPLEVLPDAVGDVTLNGYAIAE